MNSGYFGVVTDGSGTVVFGAHAPTSEATTYNAEPAKHAEKILLSGFGVFRADRVGINKLYRAAVEPAEQPARYVGDDHHVAVARFVLDDLGVAVDPRDSLAIGRLVGVERQRHPAHVEGESGGD